MKMRAVPTLTVMGAFYPEAPLPAIKQIKIRHWKSDIASIATFYVSVLAWLTVTALTLCAIVTLLILLLLVAVELTAGSLWKKRAYYAIFSIGGWPIIPMLIAASIVVAMAMRPMRRYLEKLEAWVCPFEDPEEW